MLPILNEDMLYRPGSNQPAKVSKITGKAGEWYIKPCEAVNGVTRRFVKTPISENDPNYRHYRNIGALVEAYGTEMYNFLNPSPKEKLPVHLIQHISKEREVSYLLASQMVNGYHGLEELAVDQRKKIEADPNSGQAVLDGNPVTGINKHFILRYLLGDFDVVNMQNLGLVKNNGHYETRSIDFGKAFCKPETALRQSIMEDNIPSFLDVVANPKAPSWIFCFTEAVKQGSQASGGIREQAVANVHEIFKDCRQDGSGRDKPGLPKVPEEVFYLLPEAIANPTETRQTLEHLAATDMQKLAEMAEPYETAIVEYINQNGLELAYKKGDILKTIQERLGQISQMTQKWAQEGIPEMLKDTAPRFTAKVLRNSSSQGTMLKS